jgi:hypothetical protein
MHAGELIVLSKQTRKLTTVQIGDVLENVGPNELSIVSIATT